MGRSPRALTFKLQTCEPLEVIPVRGKRVLITGGTGGLGLGVTPVVLSRGVAAATVPYRSQKSIDRLKGVLPPADFDRVRFVQANLSDEADVEKLVASMGGIDILFHLVGGFSMGDTHTYSYDDWKKDIDLNLNVSFLVCKHALAGMLDNGYGRIVAVGSRGAVEPGAKLAAYCAAKAGTVALIKSIAEEVKDKNITANVVLPSIIDTPNNRKAMGEENADKWVKPESLAEAICFLASETAKDISGAIVPVYGRV